MRNLAFSGLFSISHALFHSEALWFFLRKFVLALAGDQPQAEHFQHDHVGLLGSVVVNTVVQWQKGRLVAPLDYP